jgi:shikimate kinase
MAEPAAAGTGTLRKSVVLVGMMGSGKTAVGRALAAHLGVPFRDSDHEIEKAADRTIPEIFARDGEPFFRRKEAQVIARLMEDSTPAILSTGGGAFMAQENRATIARNGMSVWLDAPLPLLWARVRHKDSRPLLRTSDPFATLKALFEARTPVYALADLRVPAEPPVAIEAMARRVAAAIAATRPDVLEGPR